MDCDIGDIATFKEKIIQWHYLALKCARIKVSRGKTMSDTLIRDNKDYGSVGEFWKSRAIPQMGQ